MELFQVFGVFTLLWLDLRGPTLDNIYRFTKTVNYSTSTFNPKGANGIHYYKNMIRLVTIGESCLSVCGLQQTNITISELQIKVRRESDTFLFLFTHFVISF